jgi:hypothetical protein
MVQYYRPLPSSKDQYHIWTSASLPEMADEAVVIEAIDDWATLNAYVYSKENHKGQLEYHIQWVNPQGYIIKTQYETFRKWILCACGQQLQEQQQNLSLSSPDV